MKHDALRIYRPTADWAGIGYKHWMVALENGPYTRTNPPRCGIGLTFKAAVANFVEQWGTEVLR